LGGKEQTPALLLMKVKLKRVLQSNNRVTMRSRCREKNRVNEVPTTRGETVEAKLKRPGVVATDDLSYGEETRKRRVQQRCGRHGQKRDIAKEEKKRKKEKRKEKRSELGRSRST
jgi:hypothetical protein